MVSGMVISSNGVGPRYNSAQGGFTKRNPPLGGDKEVVHSTATQIDSFQ
jgi:hypothetical protein